jgi:hypothetical protein
MTISFINLLSINLDLETFSLDNTSFIENAIFAIAQLTIQLFLFVFVSFKKFSKDVAFLNLFQSHFHFNVAGNVLRYLS